MTERRRTKKKQEKIGILRFVQDDVGESCGSVASRTLTASSLRDEAASPVK